MQKAVADGAEIEKEARGRLQAIRYVLEQFDYEGRDLTSVPPLDPLIIAEVTDLNQFGDD